MIKFDKLVPGMTLLDIHSHLMGNTKLRELGLWKVVVISVDKDNRTAMCSWNSNTPELYVERRFKSLYIRPTKAYLKQEARRAARGGRWI